MANAARMGRMTTAASSPFDRPLGLVPLFCVSAPDPDPSPLPFPSLSPPEPPSLPLPPPEVESGSSLEDPLPVFAGEAELLAPVAPDGLVVAVAPEAVPAVPCELEAEPVTDAVFNVPVVPVAVPVAVDCPAEALDVFVVVDAPVPVPTDDPVAVACPLEVPPPFPFATVED